MLNTVESHFSSLELRNREFDREICRRYNYSEAHPREMNFEKSGGLKNRGFEKSGLNE